jgi:hypothetical protein
LLDCLVPVLLENSPKLAQNGWVLLEIFFIEVTVPFTAHISRFAWKLLKVRLAIRI